MGLCPGQLAFGQTHVGVECLFVRMFASALAHSAGKSIIPAVAARVIETAYAKTVTCAPPAYAPIIAGPCFSHR